MQRTFSSWKRFGFLYKFSDTFKLEQKALNIISTFNEKVIVERSNILRNKKGIDNNESNDTDSNNDDDKISGMKKRTAFLDMLLTTTTDGENLPDQMIRDEVATFMYAVCISYPNTNCL